MPVSFESAGYGGAVTQESWANLASDLGHTYSVEGIDSWAVTPATGDRAIAIAPGVGYGHGVNDTTVDIESMFIPAVTSGASRYDMIVARRDWSTKLTTFEIVAGSTTRTLPTRANTPGFLDEQPLALVKVNAGSTAIAEVVDLRTWATDGGMLARDALARLYLARLGARVKIAGEVWSYEHITPTTTDWVNEDGSGPWVNLVLNAGWHNVASPARVRLVGRGAFIHVWAEVYFDGPTIYEGWIIAPFPGGMVPNEHTFIPGLTNYYRNGTVYSVYAGGLAVGPFPIGLTCQAIGIAPLK
jgi:hypothetical protein